MDKDELIKNVSDIIQDKEFIPRTCEDSGLAEWTVGEADKLAKAIVEALEVEVDEEAVIKMMDKKGVITSQRSILSFDIINDFRNELAKAIAQSNAFTIKVKESGK